MSKLCDNSLTQLGTDQFKEHTVLITTRVEQIMRKANPVCTKNDTLDRVMMSMTESGLGAVSVVSSDGVLLSIFTDGDLRRAMQEHGKDVFSKKVSELNTVADPLTIEGSALLESAVKLFKDKQVDNIVVTSKGKPVGILDIQDLVKINLLKPDYL
jgi:transaldolase